MAELRPLTLDDIPKVVALRRRVFARSAQVSDEALGQYYQTLLFANPWRDERYPSLIHEGSDGAIAGFIGLIPRPMQLGAEKITAITATELMVTPESRGFIGPKLVRRVLDGPQDVTYSDRSNEPARVLFDSLGGGAALWYSMYWSVSLDGNRVGFTANAVRQNFASRMIGRAGRLLEKISARLAGTTLPPAATVDEPLIFETVESIVRKVGARRTLVPEYNPRSLQWLLDRLRERRNAGRLVTAQVTKDAEPIGVLVYSVHPTGEADVVQLLAIPGRETAVWDHLLFHAAREGAGLLRGRLDRRFASILSERDVPFTLGQPWTVVHSRRPEIAAQFLSGNALFGRMDAEWWIDT